MFRSILYPQIASCFQVVICFRLVRCLQFAICFAGTSVSATAQDQIQPQIKIKIEVKLDRTPEEQSWQVHWKAAGLDPSAEPPELRLQNWGEWDRDAGMFFSEFRSSVELEFVDGDRARKRVVVSPGNWDGSIDVTYKVRMMRQESEDRENFGLMPWCSDTYGQGFTSNTLMDLFVDDEAVDASREIVFTAATDDVIVSGWGPLSRGTHSAQLNHPIDNTVILFGEANQIAKDKSDGCDIEIVQFGMGKAIAEDTKSVMAALVKSCGDSTGLRLSNPVRIFLTDTGGGGTNVDGAMVAGYSPDQDPGFHHMLLTAHELYHEWLGGGFVPVDKESVWFQEGFTDYFALWHLAHLKLISKEQMALRLRELEDSLKDNSAIGRLAFGDSVNWRDGDGPIESMAYKGGALLAFYTDVELRRTGGSGLSKMVTDLQMLGRRVSNADIKDWYYNNGLGEFHEKWIENANFQPLTPALSSIGYELKRVDTTIAWSGMSTRDDGQLGIVSGLAVDGPAEKAGVQVGDRIAGYWLATQRKVELSEDAPKHTYGFDTFRLKEKINLEVLRDNEKLTLEIEPDQLQGVATTMEGAIEDMRKFNSFLDIQ